jgi:hypothetical protein
MTLLPGVPFTTHVSGPSTLCLGDFVTPRTSRGKVHDRSGPLHRFGMDDASGAEMLCQLAAADALGDFTLAYFADNDYESHAIGPHAALPVIDRVDAALGRMFDAAGGRDRFLRDTCVIVTSDHGHCEILPDAAQAAVRLHHVLGNLRQADLARGWRGHDEIMICPNMRAAQIYVRQPTGVAITRLIDEALADPRVDLAMWRGALTGEDTDVYCVESQRGRLAFRRGTGGDGRGHDAFGTEWSWRGDLEALDIECDGPAIVYGEYPNAFERIAAALEAANSGEVWLTARPGCEFEVPGGKPHVGGASHGALHALDSLSPVIIGGGGATRLPRALRSIDIAPLCMELLGIPMRYRVGQPR